MTHEIEATFLSINTATLREKLTQVGFELETPTYVMRRKTFDLSKAFPESNKWGRVRQEFNKVTMAIKEVRGSGIHDTFETELVVSNFETAVAFFEACGFPAKAMQENKREMWKKDGVEVTIDTWPGLNPFAEIEGPNEQSVKEASKTLGFDYKKALFGSIDLAYEKELGIPHDELNRLPEITFKNPPKKNAA